MRPKVTIHSVYRAVFVYSQPPLRSRFPPVCKAQVHPCLSRILLHYLRSGGGEDCAVSNALTAPVNKNTDPKMLGIITFMSFNSLKRTKSMTILECRIHKVKQKIAAY